MRNAICVLLHAQLKARLRYLRSAFSTRRRILLSALIILLSIVWTGQTVTSVLLRDAYPVDDFRRCVGLGLFAWTLWHILRVAWKRPESPVEWSPAERDLIVAAPFSAAQLLAYRFTVILTATLPKALLTILVLWPDLSWSSPVGLILALVGLELFRMLTDAGSCCLSRRGYLVFRAAVVGGIILLVAACWPAADPLTGVMPAPGVEPITATRTASEVTDAILARPLASAMVAPFFWCADVVAGHESPTWLVLKATGMLSMLAAFVWGIAWLEKIAHRVLLRRERLLQGTQRCDIEQQAESLSGVRPLPRIPVGGPLAWRQWGRAMQYVGSLLISMAIPALLLSPVLFTVRDPVLAFGIVFGGALFYSFVLLPEALKFDFRLDMDHLMQLKMLPMSAARVVVGQLTVPVLLACVFQFCVLIGTAVFRGIEPSILMIALCYCLPLNVLFVALDNLVFLLYPHRPTQEGFEAFLRTILKFTGKTLLITLSLATLLIWAPLAAMLARQLAVSTGIVFVWGTIAGIMLLATAAVLNVVAAFSRFDVSLHAA
ncbi:MAG: hypothetical protein RIK87_08155 [Fuerstiella sp.]